MTRNKESTALLARIDEVHDSLRALLLAADHERLVTRPKQDRWSALENARHLLFAEQLHLQSLIDDRMRWSPLGLTPAGLARKFPEVGVAEVDDVRAVLRAWARVHASVRRNWPDASADMQRRLERHMKHLLRHELIIERLLRDRGKRSG